MNNWSLSFSDRNFSQRRCNMDISKQIQNIIPLIHMGMGGRCGWGGGRYRSYSYRTPAPEKFKIFTAWLPSTPSSVFLCWWRNGSNCSRCI